MTRRCGGYAPAAWPSPDRSAVSGDRCCCRACGDCDFLASLRVLPTDALPAGISSTARSANWPGGEMRRRVFLPARYSAKSDSAANRAPSRRRYSPHTAHAQCRVARSDSRRTGHSRAAKLAAALALRARARRHDWRAPRARQARPREIPRPQERFGAPQQRARSAVAAGCRLPRRRRRDGAAARLRIGFDFVSRWLRHRRDDAKHAGAADERADQRRRRGGHNGAELGVVGTEIIDRGFDERHCRPFVVKPRPNAIPRDNALHRHGVPNRPDAACPEDPAVPETQPRFCRHRASKLSGPAPANAR